MFRAILDEPSILVKSLSVISNLVLEGTFLIKNDSLNLVAMDRANVSMVIYKLLSSAFSSWEIDSEKKITLNLEKLVQILKRVSSRDKIMLELDEENNKLNVIMKGISTRTFSLPLLEDGELRDIPSNLVYDSKIEVDTSILKQGIEDASLISDAVVFVANKEVFTMKAEGDVSKTSLTLTKDSPALYSLQIQEAIRAKYSIDYLLKMIKASSLSDKVSIRFKTDYPLRLDFTVMDKLNLGFILAPRIETD